MTIKEYIIENTIKAKKVHLSKLAEMQAPAIVLTALANEIEMLEVGYFECKGETELLEQEFISDEIKKGRCGIPYHVFNGNINYFPKAKYGRFIAKGEVK